jgi:uncharacterized protein (TIGR01777 family)
MNITITGATGFIGRRLIERLSAAPHQLHALTRHTNVKFGDIAVWTTRWDPMTETPPPESVVNADAVVHLAGEPVAQRWTTAAKFQIRESRVQGTRRLVEALSKSKRKPAVLVSGSAVGIYGSRGDEILTESSARGHGYLAEVCEAWEKEASVAESLGIRVVTIRTGIVLGRQAARCRRCCRRSKHSSAAESDPANSGCRGFSSTIWWESSSTRSKIR